MNQENQSEISLSIVKDRKKMFEQNVNTVRLAYPKKTSTIPKENKEIESVTTKSESSRNNLSQSSINTPGIPPEIIRQKLKNQEVIRDKIEKVPNLDLQNNHQEVKIDNRSKTVSQSQNVKSPFAKKIQFCENVHSPPLPLSKLEKVNQENSSSDVLPNSLTTNATALSEKLQQLNSKRSLLIPPPPPPPPPPTKSETNQNAEIAKNAQLNLIPLPPPSTEAEILRPNSLNKSSLMSPTVQRPPVLPPTSTKSDSIHSSTIAKTSNQNISSQINVIAANIQKHPVPPPPPSIISENFKKDISNNIIVSSTALAPPLPPSPHVKGIEITAKDSLNNLRQEHSMPHNLSGTLGKEILNTASSVNLTPPVPPPPPSSKIAKQSNNLIGWAINPTNEQKTNCIQSDISMPIENQRRKPLETSKVPPIVATPPSLESVRKIKENVKILNPDKGNAEDVYDEDDDFVNYPWYFDVTKDKAIEIMRTSTKKGTYMMRPSLDNQYVLMIRIENNETKKFKIQKYNDGWILGEPSNMKKKHPSLLALMEHYKTNGVKFSNKTLVLKEPASKQ